MTTTFQFTDEPTQAVEIHFINSRNNRSKRFKKKDLFDFVFKFTTTKGKATSSEKKTLNQKDLTKNPIEITRCLFLFINHYTNHQKNSIAEAIDRFFKNL